MEYVIELGVWPKLVTFLLLMGGLLFAGVCCAVLGWHSHRPSRSAVGKLTDSVLLVWLGATALALLTSPFAVRLGVPATTSVQGVVQQEELGVAQVSPGGDIWLEEGLRIPASATGGITPAVGERLQLDCRGAPRLCSPEGLESAEGIEALLGAGGFVGAGDMWAVFRVGCVRSVVGSAVAGGVAADCMDFW